MNVELNPRDVAANHFMITTFRHFDNVDAKFFQPGFEYKYRFVTATDTMLYLTWVNGWKRQYNLAQRPFHIYEEEIRYINDDVELQRGFEGIEEDIED